MDENALVHWLRQTLPGGEAIGDDAAILEAESWAVTVDQQIEGVHVPVGVDPAIAARRLLAVNLSDLAAMGATPTVGFLALGAPATWDHRRFFRAFSRAARLHGLRIAGGDLASQPRFGASLTLLGRRPERGRWLRRNGARPGHHLWLGGTLGEAALGLELLSRGVRIEGRTLHLPTLVRRPRSLAAAARRAIWRQLRPTPQLTLGRWLACETATGAAIDVSDGLARDLHRLCRASEVGAEIDLGTLPDPAGASRLAETLSCPLRDLQLFGGEDYVLLFSIPADQHPPEDLMCHRIGTVRSQRVVSMRAGGQATVMPDRGWDHLNASKKALPKQDL